MQAGESKRWSGAYSVCRVPRMASDTPLSVAAVCSLTTSVTFYDRKFTRLYSLHETKLSIQVVIASRIRLTTCCVVVSVRLVLSVVSRHVWFCPALSVELPALPAVYPTLYTPQGLSPSRTTTTTTTTMTTAAATTTTATMGSTSATPLRPADRTTNDERRTTNDERRTTNDERRTTNDDDGGGGDERTNVSEVRWRAKTAQSSRRESARLQASE